MLKVLMSDLHFGSNQNSKIFLEMQVNYFKNFVAPFMRENKISRIEFLGDVFHHKELTDNNVKKEFLKIVRDILKDFEIRIILGNHDIYYRDSLSTHSLHFIEDLSNVQIIDKNTLIVEENAKQFYVPWVIDQEKFEAEFEKYTQKGQVNIVMGHFEMKGFPLNKLHDAKHGTSVESMDLSKVEKVFSGHYHTPSQRKFGDCIWQYLGSPFQHTRIDGGDKKGFVVFDTESLKYDFIYSEMIMEFKTIEFNPIKIELPKEDEIKGNSIDLMVVSTELGKVKFEKFVSDLREMNPMRLEIKPVPPSLVENEDGETSLIDDTGEVKGSLDLIDDYLGVSIKDDKLRSEVMEKIIEIHSEAEESILQSELSEN